MSILWQNNCLSLTENGDEVPVEDFIQYLNEPVKVENLTLNDFLEVLDFVDSYTNCVLSEIFNCNIAMLFKNVCLSNEETYLDNIEIFKSFEYLDFSSCKKMFEWINVMGSKDDQKVAIDLFPLGMLKNVPILINPELQLHIKHSDVNQDRIYTSPATLTLFEFIDTVLGEISHYGEDEGKMLFIENSFKKSVEK